MALIWFRCSKIDVVWWCKCSWSY